MFGFSKGKIDFILSNYNYSPGQEIIGTLLITTKKPLEGKELTIRLIGQERLIRHMGTTTNVQYITVFDFKQPLDGSKQYYNSGAPLEYRFNIKIPSNVLEEQAPKGTLGNIVKAAQAFQGRSRRIKWFLEGNLSVKGIDIKKKVQVNIS